MSRIKSLLKRADWLQHVSTWRTSGLTQAAYSRQHQLNATTFNGWVLLDRKASSANTCAPLTAVPVTMQSKSLTTPPSPVTSTTTAIERSIVVQHGSGWQLALPADVQINWLAQLLNALA